MLCQFTFKNFKSYKNETVFDMQAVSGQGFENSLLKSEKDRSVFLPVSVIYGPNAGGKSNVLEALICVLSIVMKPILIFKEGLMSSGDIQWSPFLFDEKSPKLPTEFELYFRPDNEYEYNYKISVFESNIISESLYRKKIGGKGFPAKIFEREKSKIELGAAINKSTIKFTEINEQMPYLSFLSINYKLAEIESVISWFEKCILRNYAKPGSERQLYIVSDMEFKKKIVALLNEVGINISDFSIVEKNDNKNMYDVFFEHIVNEKKYTLNILHESDGTQKLFVILPLVIVALNEGRMLVIDELDAKLHPKLLKFVIMLFKIPEINKKGAQLIFTSHDVSTMKSSVFRTDEIWFACKQEDETSELYSLYELRDESGNRIQPSAAFDKQYLEGRYGADPYFCNMMNWG